MKKFTPWTNRIAIIGIVTCITTAIICRESSLALLLAGGLLTIIDPNWKASKDE